MEEEKDAYYVVQKGDVIGIYKSLRDLLTEAGISVNRPPPFFSSSSFHSSYVFLVYFLLCSDEFDNGFFTLSFFITLNIFVSGSALMKKYICFVAFKR